MFICLDQLRFASLGVRELFGNFSFTMNLTHLINVGVHL